MRRGRPKSRFSSPPASKRRMIDRKPIRPLERERMRPWLIGLLDREDCHQLVWLNRRDKVFRIAWKHAAGQTFNAINDATLFQRWAEHTGKYYQGDRADPKKWKANFRCALNSLPDVDEDKAQGIKKGNNAFKVYRFLDQKKAKRTKKQMTITIEDSEESVDEYSLIRKIGTKSRPRKITNDGLDSEGSENGSSPGYVHGDHSDWEVEDCGRQELLAADDEEADSFEYEEDEIEQQQQTSPLPDFDRLGQHPFVADELPQKNQTEASPTPVYLVNNSQVYSRFPISEVETCDSPLFDDPMEESVIQMIFDPYMQTGIQEEVVYSDDSPYALTEGNVIVQQEQAGVQDYLTYTSIADL